MNVTYAKYRTYRGQQKDEIPCYSIKIALENMIRVHSCHMICTCYVLSCSFLPTPATENLYFFQNILKHNMVLRIREFIRKLIPSDPRLPPKQLIPPDPRLPPKQLIPSDP
jgi:hypothetical protein